MKSIRETTENKLIIKKSSFICTLIPCDNPNNANEIIKHHKEKYFDANHNCSAYIVNGHEKANDDGEPSKTAGMPMLNVLQKQELTNIIAIVTRYFGGIKLGAGGLTRAYTQSVAEALKVATIVEKQPINVYQLTLDYTHTRKFEHLCKMNHIMIENIEYLDQVNYVCYIKDETFFDLIQDLTNNQYQRKFIHQVYIEV
ncbi:YigZ family protein [Tannockella kyphosi]|uniref:YigZ family protein n=1 Tax=Tannockella kyphosi TaxID=2899121 RepID=UPI0020121871|nr:YigZ family protein [Tannockella kyphosi]